jgi:hypothetical protein
MRQLSAAWQPRSQRASGRPVALGHRRRSMLARAPKAHRRRVLAGRRVAGREYDPIGIEFELRYLARRERTCTTLARMLPSQKGTQGPGMSPQVQVLQILLHSGSDRLFWID